MLLTIGMIVKNEEKYLRRCLEALQPILKSISSELIIVDTGSTDRTVEIAKEFTDKVLFFEWINDFAAARNFGLEKAQGEWFMAVDADEIFISCDDIIKFFKSGEYKNYNSASYSVRNYSNPDRTGRYVDFYVPRLTKLLPETKYENAVHEKLNTHGQPLRLLADIADHYGYIAAVSAEKSKRNYEILKKRLESGEENASLYRELFEALNSDDETKNQAYDYLKKGIELCKRNSDDYVIALYHCAISAYVSEKRYDEAMEIYEEYFSLDKSIKNEIRNTDLEIIAFAGIALYSAGRYEDGYKMIRSYFDLYDNIERNNIRTRDILYSYRYMSDKNAFAEMNLYYAVCCIETGHFKQAEDSFRSYPASEYAHNPEHYFARINQEKNLISKYDTNELVSLLSERDMKLQNELFLAFRSALFSMDSDVCSTIINKLEGANLKSAAQRKILSIYRGYLSGEAGDALLIDYADKFGMDHPDLFLIMYDECMDVIPYLSKCEDMELFIKTGLRTIDGFKERMIRINYENVSRSNIYISLKACLCTITELLRTGTSAAFLYNAAGNLGIRYLEAFGENNIPSEVMAAVIIAEINILRSGRDFRGCLNALRKLIQLNKLYAPIAVEYQNLIKADMENIK